MSCDFDTNISMTTFFFCHKRMHDKEGGFSEKAGLRGTGVITSTFSTGTSETRQN